MSTNRRFLCLALGSFGAILILGFISNPSLIVFRGGLLQDISHLISFLAYFLMLSAWGLSINRRIIHRAVHHNIMGIHVLIMAWLFLREIRWYYTSSPTALRYLCYAYYIPMVLIPLLAFNAAKRVGSVREKHDQKGDYCLYAMALGLIVMTLTNDLHGFVFHLNGFSDRDPYTRGLGYFIIIGWVLVLELAMIVLVIKHCSNHVDGNQKYLPLLFVGVSVMYGIIYLTTDFHYIEPVVAFSYLTILIWESCVVLGMIPVNVRYEDFFRYGTLRGQIVDNEGKLYIRSEAKDGLLLNQALFRVLKTNEILHYGHDVQLHIYPITAGYMIWQEDISRISDLIDEIRTQKKELEEKKTLEERELQAQVHQNSIEESTRIYTLINSQMEEGISHINYLADQMRRELVPERKRKLLFLINMTGVFLKRRSNLIMMDEGGEKLTHEEMNLCLAEVQKNLAPYGIESSFLVQVRRNLSRNEAITCLDLLEQFLVENIDQLHQVSVTISELPTYMRLRISDPSFRSVEYLFDQEGVML